MWLCWAASCQHNDSSSTLWMTTNLKNFLHRPHALHSGQKKKKKDTHVRGEFQTSENGWWARSGRLDLQELRKHASRRFFFPVFDAPWCSQGTLLSWQSCQGCAFNPCRDMMSFPWLHWWCKELAINCQTRRWADIEHSLWRVFSQHRADKIYFTVFG